MSLALEVRPQTQGVGDETENPLKTQYLQGLHLIERLHRLLLDVIKNELDRLGTTEINSVQALLLYNIGDSELTAGELRSRGYYLGSNVSYNLKKLVEMGYIHHKRSETDRRSVRVSLTDRGRDVCTIINELYDRQLGSIVQVGQLNDHALGDLNASLVRLERFWSDQIRYQL